MSEPGGSLSIPGQSTAWGFYRGRVGLAALLAGLAPRPGGSVAIQAFTCRAVPDALLTCGLRPEYVDIEPGGVNMDPDALVESVSPDTRVVVVQHTFGIPARVAEIAEFCRSTERVLIEDCCHSVTSTLNGGRVGSFGLGGFTSFEWGKEVIAGVGGAAWANEESASARLEHHWRDLERPSSFAAARQAAQWAAFRLLYRPSTYWQLKAAFSALGGLGVIESNAVPNGAEEVNSSEYGLQMHPSGQRRVERALARVDVASRHRSEACRTFAERINNPQIRHVPPPEGAEGGWVRYPLLVPQKHELLALARRHRVELADWYVSAVDPLAAGQYHLARYVPGSCPEAERRATEIVTLPTVASPDSTHTKRALELLQSWDRPWS